MDALRVLRRVVSFLPARGLRPRGQLITAAALVAAATAPATAQPAARTREADAKPAPWFGVPLPPKRGGVPAVLVGPRGVRPAIVPPGEAKFREFDGATIRADLETIVGFSKESHSTREIGTGQLWGRVTGFPSSSKTITWAAEQFRKAGISDVRVQPLTQDPQARFVLPTSWELKILGDASYGPGTNDLVLESAMPVGSDIRVGRSPRRWCSSDRRTRRSRRSST